MAAILCELICAEWLPERVSRVYADQDFGAIMPPAGDDGAAE